MRSKMRLPLQEQRILLLVLRSKMRLPLQEQRILLLVLRSKMRLPRKRYLHYKHLHPKKKLQQKKFLSFITASLLQIHMMTLYSITLHLPHNPCGTLTKILRHFSMSASSRHPYHRLKSWN